MPAVPIVGAAIGIGGAYMQYRSQKNQARQQEELAQQDAIAAYETAEMNAALLRQDAQDKLKVAQINYMSAIDDAGNLDLLAQADALALQKDAEAAQKSGNYQVETQRLVNARSIADQFSMFARAGVSFSGSVLAVMTENQNKANEMVSNLVTTVNANVSRLQGEANLTLQKGNLEAERIRKQAEIARAANDLQAARMNEEADLILQSGGRISSRYSREGQAYGAQGDYAGWGLGANVGESILGGSRQLWNYYNPTNRIG